MLGCDYPRILSGFEPLAIMSSIEVVKTVDFECWADDDKPSHAGLILQEDTMKIGLATLYRLYD